MIGTFSGPFKSTLGRRNEESSSSPGPVTHLATLETCTRISTEFCKTSAATRYFHTDFIAHEEAFVVLGNTFFGRFATVKFLERMRLRQCPRYLSRRPTTKPYPTLEEANQIMSCAKSWGYVLQFNVDNITYFSKTTLKVLLTSVFG